MSTLAEIRRAAVARLNAAGIDEAALDAALLLQSATGFDRAGLTLNAERALPAEAAARFEALLARREAREPVSQILGRSGFWSLDLGVTADVLTPRPETEHIVETLLAAPAPARPRVLDLGTGSGAILLAILSERPEASGLGVDASGEAITVARANAVAAGLADRARFAIGDWDEGLDERFDLIGCNPPYIESATIETLQPEVRDREPRIALDGGRDGLDVYRRLAPRLAGLLNPGGTAAFEVGAGQADVVLTLFSAQSDLKTVGVARDLAGLDRVVWARRA